jgi:hypothetical protein
MQQDTSEQSEATDEIVVDDIAATNAEAAETAAESAESAADVPGAARQRSRPPAAGLGVAAAVGLGVAAVALLGGRRRGPSLREGESIQMSVHPRRVVWRYLTTLGMWEAARRNTRFTLTDERAIIEDGIVSRRMRSAPLSAIKDVSLRTGPWQGYVDIAIAGRGGTKHTEIGPLRSPVAREVAALVMAASRDAR